MPNGFRTFKRAGVAKGKYAASKQRGRGIEYQKAGQAAADEYSLERMYERTGVIAEAIGVASGMYQGAVAKKELGKAAEGMKATQKKQGFGDWLFGAEKEYTTTDEAGKSMSYSSSELKTAWGAKKADYAETYDPSKAQTPSPAAPPVPPAATNMAQEAGITKSAKGFIGKHKGLDILKGKGFLGEEKGIDTDTKNWFSNLFKGGADQGDPGDGTAAGPDKQAGTDVSKGVEHSQDLLDKNKNILSNQSLLPEGSSRESIKGFVKSGQKAAASSGPSKMEQRIQSYREKKWAPDKTIDMDLWNKQSEGGPLRPDEEEYNPFDITSPSFGTL